MTTPGMTEATRILGGLAAGGALSLLHFGGLWITLRTLPRVARPRLWFMGSALTRYGLTLGGMWLLMQWGVAPLVAACAGFWLARSVFVPRVVKRFEKTVS